MECHMNEIFMELLHIVIDLDLQSSSVSAIV